MVGDSNFGIAHSLSAPQRALIEGDDMTQMMNYQYVRLYWLDFTNNLRFRVLPMKHFLRRLKSPRPSIAISKVTFRLVYVTMSEDFDAPGEFLYVPDLSTWRPCPYVRGHVSLMGWFQEKAPIRGCISVDLCPRGLLARVVDEIQKRSGVRFLVGIETEFILLKSTDPVMPVNYHDWSGANGLPAGALHTQVIQEIADSLLASFIDLEFYHPEASPGQFEMVVGALPPLEAADASVHVRDVIRNIASKHGLHATFAPRVFEGAYGTAAHVHISVHGPEPRTADCLTTYEKRFLAGVLEHLPALPAFTLPIPASYKRLVDGMSAGGTYIYYATENREAPIRLCNVTSVNARNFEMRFMDCTANPYLGLAAILGAGGHGLSSQAELTMTDLVGRGTAAKLSEMERRKLGITRRMPLHWEEARENLCKDGVVMDLMGPNFVEKYLSVNKILSELLENSDGGDEKAKLQRLVRFY